jgi:hypothetical protein
MIELPSTPGKRRRPCTPVPPGIAEDRAEGGARMPETFLPVAVCRGSQGRSKADRAQAGASRLAAPLCRAMHIGPGIGQNDDTKRRMFYTETSP